MGKRYEIRHLKESDLVQMYQTFSEAFSQYSVNMNMSKTVFIDRMTKKLSIDFNHSPGFFIRDKLVGFIFHAVEKYEGVLSAYNGGTGVIPGYWGRGITKMMYDHWLDKASEHGIKRSVLEVISNNHKALKAYEKVGFQITKKFKCFKLTGQNYTASENSDLKVKMSKSKSLDAYATFQTSAPSMLDCNALLSQNLANETTLEAWLKDELVGYIVFQPKVGRISQLATKKDKRRMGVGSNLIRAAIAASEQNVLTVINVEEGQTDIVAFLESQGFQNQIDQFEMQLIL